MKYNYICKDCLAKAVHTQRMESEPLTVCPQCGGRYRRALNTHTIIYKGSGFYATDSKAERKQVKGKQMLQKKAKKEKQWKPPSGRIVGQPPPT